MNDRLTAAALIRMSIFKHIPYILCTDLNEDTRSSTVASAAIRNENIVDLAMMFCQDYDQDGNHVLPCTYRRGGVEDGMTGLHTSRIDACIVNKAASHVVTSLHYDFSAFAIDHVPMVITFDLKIFDMQVNRMELAPLIPLPTTRPKWDEIVAPEASDHFNAINKDLRTSFIDALRNSDIESANAMWSQMAVNYLCHIASDYDEDGRGPQAFCPPSKGPQKGGLPHFQKQSVVNQNVDVQIGVATYKLVALNNHFSRLLELKAKLTRFDQARRDGTQLKFQDVNSAKLLYKRIRNYPGVPTPASFNIAPFSKSDFPKLADLDNYCKCMLGARLQCHKDTIVQRVKQARDLLTKSWTSD